MTCCDQVGAVAEDLKSVDRKEKRGDGALGAASFFQDFKSFESPILRKSRYRPLPAGITLKQTEADQRNLFLSPIFGNEKGNPPLFSTGF